MQSLFPIGHSLIIPSGILFYLAGTETAFALTKKLKVDRALPNYQNIEGGRALMGILKNTPCAKATIKVTLMNNPARHRLCSQ